MEPWKDYIGNGSGCMFFFNQVFIDNGLLNSEIKASVLSVSTLEIPNAKKTTAERFDIYSNTSAAKIFFYQKIKSNTFRVDAAEYEFGNRIFYNPTLSQSEAFDLVKVDDVAGLIAHIDTVELTDVNGADFLNYLL